jgi:hypothetical protein
MRSIVSAGITHIFVLHVPQQLNLPQSAFRIDLIVERVTDLLDGDLLSSLRIDSSTARTRGRQVNIATDR